ncbi:MAG TPA: zinc ribbon domain-containing protein [Desulfosalsimonadaceae bacterium]|nr:zinc ribbon domain-containing protein [Desulfosalsimonadaceae bacterium]
MNFETKEQVLERMMDQVKPICPHCGTEMQIWEIPPVAFSDGLGWDSPYMYVCFNDECPLYINGWENLWENFSQRASYRCIKSPNDNNFEAMPVFSPIGGQGQVIDDQVTAEREALKESTKKGFSILAECYVTKDEVTVMQMLMDASQPARVRLKAADMAADLGGLDAIELINNYTFGNRILQEKADEAVGKIHERHFTRECPFCAEIIKKRAKVCKHCGKEVAGK